MLNPLFCFVVIFDGASNAGHLLHVVGAVMAVWMLVGFAAVGAVIGMAMAQRSVMRLKASMAETDGTLPLPFFNRRRRRDNKFRLGLTRRQLTVGEGAALEKLHHAIDYLIQSYGLDSYASVPREQRPAEFLAAELLLQSRAEMLNAHPPLPSFFYLLQRRLEYLMVPAK